MVGKFFYAVPAAQRRKFFNVLRKNQLKSARRARWDIAL
jgi:hypothetical protein